MRDLLSRRQNPTTNDFVFVSRSWPKHFVSLCLHVFLTLVANIISAGGLPLSSIDQDSIFWGREKRQEACS